MIGKFNTNQTSKLVGGPATGYRTFPRCCVCKRSWSRTAKRRANTNALIEQRGITYRICGVCLEELRLRHLIN